jgi:hypothetical protein
LLFVQRKFPGIMAANWVSVSEGIIHENSGGIGFQVFLLRNCRAWPDVVVVAGGLAVALTEDPLIIDPGVCASDGGSWTQKTFS